MFLHTTSGNFVEGGEVYIKQEWPQPAHLATNLSTYTTYQPQAKHDVTVYIPVPIILLTSLKNEHLSQTYGLIDHNFYRN